MPGQRFAHGFRVEQPARDDQGVPDGSEDPRGQGSVVQGNPQPQPRTAAPPEFFGHLVDEVRDDAGNVGIGGQHRQFTVPPRLPEPFGAVEPGPFGGAVQYLLQPEQNRDLVEDPHSRESFDVHRDDESVDELIFVNHVHPLG
ncbi:hypothetical protein Amsp01_001140 [Amycolatopsis sp. NBRC 101858]|nr:hypothetical protein Amsp01_001140 [Amycolatopsis sp. NBRC 101858]